MSTGNNHIKTYTAEDIYRYHSGTMSLTERHALEKAALEDPFLADAIEGYVHSTNAEDELSYLRNQLAQRTKRGKVVSIKRYSKNVSRIAALLILVLSASWGIHQLLQDKTEEIALEPQNTEKTATTQSNEIDLSATNVDTTLGVANNQTGIESKQTSSESEVKKVRKPSAVKRPSPVSNPVAVAKENTEAVATESASVAQMMKDDVRSSDTSSLTQTLDNRAVALTVRGQVTDLKGAPVPFATIAQPSTRQATLTDINGRFEMALRDTTSPLVSAVGFQSQKLNVQGGIDNKIVLQESSGALQEVVVTGYGQARKRSATTPAKARIETGELEPAVGWTNFDKYVEENLNVPDETVRRNVHGEVQLSFTVNAAGEPINIKVEKSLCPQCDDEAIRLLKEGPKWKTKRGKRGSVRMRF